MNWKQLFAVILAGWFIVNLLQSLFTEVMNDEAYYALYGKKLAWGYFDHPPMVALTTYLSALLFGGNLSVRFVTILLQVFTIALMWKVLEEKVPDSKKVVLFFVLTASMIMFASYGFVTAPDVPLLFFATLFLYAYQRFLQKDSWVNALLLCISMTGMIYSKYHAFIIIGFVVLSNFKLLANFKAWVAVVFTAVLLIPHIMWQADMDFITFRYHLVGRNFGFQWDEFLGHFPNQLVMFNPLTLGALIYVLVKFRPKDLFERALFFQIIGFQVLFFLMTFKGYVQPHWTVPTTMAMIVLLYRYSLKDAKLLRFIKRWVAPSILLIFIVRIILVTDLLPERLGFHGKEKRALAIEQVSGELPVVFTGSFQLPSTFQYFTGNEALLLSGVNSRQTQFDIWQQELKYQGKPVFIHGYVHGRSEEYDVDGYQFHGMVTDNFQSVNRVRIKYELPVEEVYPGDVIEIPFEIINPCNFDIDFNHPEFPVRFLITFAKKRKIDFSAGEVSKQFDILAAGAEDKASFCVVVPDLEPGKYQVALTLENKICPAKNSDFASLRIKGR
ncbi:glycosyltransferase family 39 protein [Paludibacter sp. 221]|uniref:ArnT family glycosyltransferase n=1 Tax=Paludibacter sp. 221 TaxID=2302939 RepID=UPI0013D6817F|nr:glycosyltransferase family 39 protein [Paludibacter sp. 221]